MAASLPGTALIGCGKMGGALLHGWLKSGMDSHFYVLDPAGLPATLSQYGPNTVSAYTSAEELAAARPDAGIFIMAVKPQIMDEVCAAIRPAVEPGSLILSIAAGQTIAAFEKRFGEGQPVIRAMPNTPAAIGEGMIVMTANRNVNSTQKKQAEILLRAAGLTEFITDESLMDAVTAVSGSGPAYVFLLIEAMARAGEKAGLPPELSMELARQTVIGSAALARMEKDTDAATLRQNVTSPGGTTEAALKVLMNNGEFEKLLENAIAAATDRGKQLST